MIGRRELIGMAGLLGAGLATRGVPAAAAPARSRNVLGDPNPMRIIPLPPQVPAKEGIARLPDVDLYYWDTGGPGQVIVLLHALTSSAYGWGYQQPVLAKAGYRVIAYSRRGFRGSTSGTSTKPQSGAEDLKALVDYLKLDRFHAVGTAGGAFVATAFALQWPERLRSLTMACSMLGMTRSELGRYAGALAAPGFNDLAHDFRELSPSYRALNPEGHKLWLEHEQKAHAGNTPVTQAYGPVPTTVARLRTLKVPTLVMPGDADLIAPPPLMRMLADAIPDSEMAVIPEAGHAAFWERPDLFNRALLDFLRRHRG